MMRSATAEPRLDCEWDVASVSRELAGNHVLWRTRDLLLDGVPDERAREMFTVAGRENLDAALGLGRGCIVLANHFGAHLLPAHWLFRENFPVRFYMERPRHISRYMARHFETDGPLGQDKLFISRQGLARRFGELDPAGRARHQGGHAALSGRRRPLDRATDRISPVSGPHDAILDDLGRPGRDDRSAGRHGLLPDGARRPLPHRVSPRLSRPQGYRRTAATKGAGSSISSRSSKSRSAVIRPTATTISSGKSSAAWSRRTNSPAHLTTELNGLRHRDRAFMVNQGRRIGQEDDRSFDALRE